MLSDEELAAFMNDPRQRQAEVVVAHRIGYWGGENIEGCTPEEIAEADAYLEAHIQSRITAAVRADMQREVRTVEELRTLGRAIMDALDSLWATNDQVLGKLHARDEILAALDRTFTPSTPNQQGAEQ